MQNTFTPIFFAHAGAGAIMILSGAVAIGARKGRDYHRVSGNIYAFATAAVAVTGFTIAIQKSNQFLIATSVFVLYMMGSAYRSLYLKQLFQKARATLLDWAIVAGAGCASAYLLYMGITGVMNGNDGSVVSLVFGAICLWFTIRDLKKYTRGPGDKKHWLFNHISGMMGSYIGGLTAFLAVNAGFFSNSFNLYVWLGPTVLGVPYIIYTISKYKTKPAASDALPVKIRVD